MAVKAAPTHHSTILKGRLGINALATTHVRAGIKASIELGGTPTRLPQALHVVGKAGPRLSFRHKGIPGSPQCGQVSIFFAASIQPRLNRSWVREGRPAEQCNTS